MLSPSYQPAQHGSLKFPTSSTWSYNSAKQRSHKMPVTICVGISHEHLGVSEEKERTHSGKDVWRLKRNGVHLQKCSEAAESTSYVSDYLPTNSASSLSIRNGLSLANLGDATVLNGTSENDSERSSMKKPSQRAKDIWRSRKKDGSIGMGTEVLESKRDVLMAKQRINHAGSSKLLTEEQVADKLGAPTVNRKRIGSGKDVWSARESEDGLIMDVQSLGNRSSDLRKRLYLVDIHSLCYDGNMVQPRKALEWMKLLFSEVTQANPIIAVMDGARGNEFRRALLPCYKAKRRFFRPLAVGIGHSTGSAASDLRKALPLIHGFLTLCHIPVVKLEFAEADDVIATLARQARQQGFQVVIASPDMDFQQLLTPDVHMLLPLPELRRWSFYTLQHYVMQNTVTPNLELGLKCLLGDASDNVPGLSNVAPGFGRRTALKLMQKHGSVERLLAAAATRTVGKEYIQDALVKHADLLRRNLQVLSFRTDVDVVLEEQWCRTRCLSNDVLALELLNERLRSE